jgi:hypothetical protein
MFWRAAIKITIALIVVGFVMVGAKGGTALIHRDPAGRVSRACHDHE